MKTAERPPLGELDLEVLRFAGEQRLFAAAHAQSLLRVPAATAASCLDVLHARGLVCRHEVFRDQPPAYTVTAAGLRLLGSRLGAPRLDVSVYRHDMGVAWAWLAARAGRWGEAETILSERTLRSRDRIIGPEGTGGGRLAVRLPGTGPAGRPRLHYPDLVIGLTGGRRLAVELEISGKGARRLATILRGYVGDPRVDGILYLVDQPATSRAVQGAARAAGACPLLRLEPFSWTGRGPGYAGNARGASRAMAGAHGASRPAAEARGDAGVRG